MIPTWHIRDRVLSLPRAQVMGIVNVTPDSFSDGGQFFDPTTAVAHALDLVRQGADILDIGGESSRPGAAAVSAEEELRRVVPVVRELVRQTNVPLSIDTTKAVVAEQALAAGAHIINDISALQADAAMAEVVRRHQAGVVLMHMLGTPQTMQNNPVYRDVVAEVVGFLEARLQATKDLGIAESRVVLDPGVGFGKRTEHNLQLLANLDRVARLGRPVLLGVSRKGFLERVLGREMSERLAGSLAAACHGVLCGQAAILRVHDVAPTRDAVILYEALSQVRLASRP